MIKILLTGSTGFIGSKLGCELNRRGYDVVSAVRKKTQQMNESHIAVGELHGNTNFLPALLGVHTVIHLAAKAHIKEEHLINSAAEFARCNTDATITLAEQAIRSGAKRFIFISSIGVNGSNNTQPFTFDDVPNPAEAYAVSKHHAEIKLQELAKKTGLEVVIIRPPLVYGVGAPGNFGKLVNLAEKNLPLPLGSINNQRSFVAVDNLIDLIITCVGHPNAANKTFLVSDDESVSTSNLLKQLTLAAGKKPLLLPMPVAFLRFIAGCVGKKDHIDKLANSLTIDIEFTKKTLNWKPPITLDEGIRRCFE
ncbi:NAD-dependent epimerase/dehydratase family protein [Pseudoalteromonas sp. BSi20439]|uniref:NAD-dependent epimerase/dehydratase family protein n=1 Tax=Pseudoalteromonas sp. BSi20439 TaxID=420915 RepID=UPI0002316789|nr:NAD-dependent epimerase/dehydratase family protein [Pseudoalteromonas sp. BSi20439]GAA71501.1 UDP-glucose 4-epimerase [Pseudoalteromonas sp. BSi20439]